MEQHHAMIRTVSSKDGGEVTDAEDNNNNHRTVAREVSGFSDDVVASITEAPAPAPSPNNNNNNMVADEIPVNEDEEDEDDDEDDEYEYEDDDDAAFSGFLVDNPAIAAAAASMESSSPENQRADEPAKIEEEQQQLLPAAAVTTKKWRQPTKEAVDMSLRAETEKSGGKRRLAQDLYRIMNQETKDRGFSLQPSSEDSMDKWTIKLFQFDEDSNLAKDMKVLGLENIEIEMSFPEQYPFEPPFVRVMRPRFKRQTGFVMNGALCMELLTKDGWNPVNDIESVIVSVRSLLVVGDGRLEAACNISEKRYNELLEAASQKPSSSNKRQRTDDDDDDVNNEDDHHDDVKNKKGTSSSSASEQQRKFVRDQGGSYSISEAEAAYSHLSDYHKKKGWDSSGWWARKG